MSVHYKFKSEKDYDTVTFDGLHISIGDLKTAISQQKRIGKTSDFDLQITNAQTKEVYTDDSTLIPKNTSLLVARIPFSQNPKKQWDNTNNSATPFKDVSHTKGVADLSRMEGSEQDKINAMISQSTSDYDPSNYQKIRGQNQRGAVPSNYTCYKCQNRGHWIKDCPVVNSSEPIDIRRSTGIPRSFMVPVEGPKAPGAMMTPNGQFAVPVVDREAYLASENAGAADAPMNAPVTPEPNIPDELICSLCRDLLTDAVMIPCCGNSFCDECIRNALLDSEDHECPDCREKEISPTTLIPNRFLRNSVSSFRNQTGYSRRAPHRQPTAPPVKEPIPAVAAPPVHPPSANGPSQQPSANAESEESEEGDGVKVRVPPAHVSRGAVAHIPVRQPRYGPPAGLNPPGLDAHNMPMNLPRPEEQRASTPTIDERRDPMNVPGFVRGVPTYPPPIVRPPAPPHSYNPGFNQFPARPPVPYQPPPPGIKDEPLSAAEDPLVAFNRMIREKELRARRRDRRDQQRRHSPLDQQRRLSPLAASPRLDRSPRSPPPRSTRSPQRYSRSRSISRGRIRRSPWSPRRRHSRERSISISRSPSPRRRMRSPIRFHSPLRSPRSPLRSPLRSPRRSPLRSPPRSPPRSQPRSPIRSPHLRSPRRPGLRSPPPRSSPHRYAGVYDNMLSPPRRNVEPPYGARFEPRNNHAPGYHAGPKPIPPLANIHVEPPGYRGRYEGPPRFDDVPPGVEPPVPGFEPSPFEKPPFAPVLDRDRHAPPNFREPFRGPPFAEGHANYREPVPSGPKDIPIHISEPQHFRDNYRGPPQFREQGPPGSGSFRDAPQQPPFREYNSRNGPPGTFRDHSYRNTSYRDQPPAGIFRDGPPSGNFRDSAPPGNYRDGPGQYRPSGNEPREHNSGNFHGPQNRDERERGGFRPNVRSRLGKRPPGEPDRYRDREGRERFPERDPTERSRDDKRGRNGRDERPRDYDRSRDYERDRDREREITPERKARSPPKKSKHEHKEKRGSESRGYSHDQEGKRDKLERSREKTSPEKSKEHKEKEKKIKDKKKKKKEKETEKKKKREKKEKKDKESSKKDEDTEEKSDVEEKLKEPINPEEKLKESINPEEKLGEDKETTENPDNNKEILTTENPANNKEILQESVPKPGEHLTQQKLYDEEETPAAVDEEIIKSYAKPEDIQPKITDTSAPIDEPAEPFDGIELQVNAEELDLKVDIQDEEMLAPLPAPSKWEVDDVDKTKEPGEISSPEEEEDDGRKTKVTSEVIKRAENAIFSKASMKPIEIKKISTERLKLYSDESKKPGSHIQITVPASEMALDIKNRRHSKTPPPRLSAKERLGSKVEDVRKREPKVVHSAVERVKSKSKTPKREQPYRRVTVDKERIRESEGISRFGQLKGQKLKSAAVKGSSSRSERKVKEEKKAFEEHKPHRQGQDRERKKSLLDESHFEPDYDETVESEQETRTLEPGMKRERSKSPSVVNEAKKAKIEPETIKLDLTNVKMKPETGSESSSGSESTSSSSSSDTRKRKKKKKRAKRKKKRAASESDSDSGSSSDDHKKKKKKRKHKKKSSKKKKKSKHK